MKLYDYYVSSACYRVRIALHLKKITYETISTHLLNNGGEHLKTDYLQLNPQGLVPTLDENGHLIGQSLAIIEYLDEINPNPALLPQTPLARAQVRSMALMIACDTHPLNNLRVLTYLKQQLQASEQQVMDWYHHWLGLSFDALERRLQIQDNKNPLCYGNEISLADVCLIPQVYNAKRFGFPMEKFSIINQINDYCLSLAEFSDTAPVKILSAP